MEELVPALASYVLQREPAVLVPLPAAVSQRGVGKAGPHLMGDRFREQPELFLASSQRCLGLQALDHLGRLSGVEIGQPELTLRRAMGATKVCRDHAERLAAP